MTIHDIQGWFDFQAYYWRIAAAMPQDAVLVECGPWLGASTIYLAHSLLAHAKRATIYAVDTWQGSKNEREVFEPLMAQLPFQKFMEHISRFGVRHMVVPITMDSVAAAQHFQDESIDFVFFDTEHTEEHLTAELRAWLPKLKHQRWFGGHDIAVPGVRAAVEKVLPGQLGFYSWQQVQSCWEASKP
jgi:predicted O-methyltransferase YrrM